MYIYIYIYICIYVYIHTCIYIHIYIYLYKKFRRRLRIDEEGKKAVLLQGPRNGGLTGRSRASKAVKSRRRPPTAESVTQNYRCRLAGAPNETILRCPRLPKPCYLHRKTTISAIHQLRFLRRFGETFPPVRCLLGRFRLALQGPFDAPEPSQSSKRSDSPGNSVPQRPQSRAGKSEQTNRCPKTDDATSPEAQSNDSGVPEASKTLRFR